MTLLEVERAIRRSNFHRKTVWSGWWHSRWSCVLYFICLSVVTVISLVFWWRPCQGSRVT